MTKKADIFGPDFAQRIEAVRTEAAAAEAAAEAAAAEAAAEANLPYWWSQWYIRPRYVLYRMVRWDLAAMTQPNPWKPLAELYRLGCRPIGFVRGEFVVYAPKPK